MSGERGWAFEDGRGEAEPPFGERVPDPLPHPSPSHPSLPRPPLGLPPHPRRRRRLSGSCFWRTANATAAPLPPSASPATGASPHGRGHPSPPPSRGGEGGVGAQPSRFRGRGGGVPPGRNHRTLLPLPFTLSIGGGGGAVQQKDVRGGGLSSPQP